MLSLLANLGFAAGAQADDWERLRRIPREQRVVLDKKLREFDSLDRAEQAAARTLDEALARSSESDRANDYAVMRRYHLWLQTLPEAQRNELNAALPEKRLRMAEKLRADQRANSPATPLFFQLADFGGASPYGVATQIRVWLKLSAAEKAEVAKLPEDARRKRVFELANSLKVRVPEPTFTEEQAKAFLDRAVAKGPPLDSFLKSDDEKKKSNRRRRILDSYYLLDHPPDKVKPDTLVRFDAALPPWIRGTFDTLAPDEARRRLSVLYRLVFPTPQEMDTPRNAGAPSKPAPADPKGQAPGQPVPSKGQTAPLKKGAVPPGAGKTGPF